jgi:hypothetical protein
MPNANHRSFVRWLQTMFAVELHPVGRQQFDWTTWTTWDGVVLLDANPQLLEEVVRPALPLYTELRGNIVFFVRLPLGDPQMPPGERTWWEEVL